MAKLSYVPPRGTAHLHYGRNHPSTGLETSFSKPRRQQRHNVQYPARMALVGQKSTNLDISGLVLGRGGDLPL
eukprot:CAMPEP_0184754646 /NCGR_PEP_ID=MMETSP0315-20130426/44732_1 /TAXON_ID=101924 /ORGANISM="Rhodosorus marinus, Strain UTEX LB 2760" /LENGTH=72 /DNA_ID=CAMNT_0027234073 /DNA_START=92 /DNA_END=313 /DNA_ORIENTATION=-